MIACHHSHFDLSLVSSVEKASIWQLYGRNNLALTHSQILMLAQKVSGINKLFMVTEPVALALANVARQLDASGKTKACDSVLVFAK